VWSAACCSNNQTWLLLLLKTKKLLLVTVRGHPHGDALDDRMTVYNADTTAAKGILAHTR